MLRYPTLSLRDTQAIALARLAGDPPDVNEGVVMVGDESGPTLDLSAVVALGADMDSQIAAFEAGADGAPDRDDLEGRLSIQLYDAMTAADAPLFVLDDPGFWRYVGIVHLWPFLRWREPAFAADAPWAKIESYIDGRAPSECVALRMYIRASIANEAGSLELAAAVPRATDFWRSHLVRVGTGSVPPLAAAFIREQVRDRLAADPLRGTARHINRTKRTPHASLLRRGGRGIRQVQSGRSLILAAASAS